MSFNFQEYQELAVRSLNDETTIEMLALHLVEKVGAIAGIKYKALKVGADSEMIEIWLTEELGWCLWCVAAIAHRVGLDSSKVPFDDEYLSAESSFKVLALSSFDLLNVDTKLSSARAISRNLKVAIENIYAIAHHNNIGISAIASINLAKVAH